MEGLVDVFVKAAAALYWSGLGLLLNFLLCSSRKVILDVFPVENLGDVFWL